MAQHTHAIPLTIDYVEISVTDLAAARDFYAAAFGWTFTDYGPGYSGIRTAAEAASEADEAGGLLLTDRVTPGGPLVLLFSDDLHATLEAVTAAGGTVVKGPYEFPGGRRFHFHDPSGNELGVWGTTTVTEDFLADRDQGEQERAAL
ncbi:VOC family protein [Agromyces aerolatus]|uniref:VOC family protein n=1 Tax=Agromyces sp. LY-1074 TaxID=3074080 RepID=UPI0028557F5A|nr:MULTISPECIES: VOC family protein [unclassified Agromyces]MDR5699651.1 VOC family protein [Agromyces sp. LY-1074]MDR5705947.1 VOC family protein [Agromyces sp. LY-1358]